MRNRKLPLLLFFFAIGVGVFCGVFFNTQVLVPIPTENTNGITVISQPTDIPWQENFVVVVVDRVGKSPESNVLGIWLMVSDQEANKTEMISIYPENHRNTYNVAHDPLTIDPLFPKSVLELDVVNSRGMLVDHVLIIDEVFLDKLVSLSPEIVINGTSYSTFSEISQNALAWENPIDALNNQITVLTSICNGNFNITAKDFFANQKLSAHIQSTTSLTDLNARWNVMILTHQENYCESFIGS